MKTLILILALFSMNNCFSKAIVGANTKTRSDSTLQYESAQKVNYKNENFINQFIKYSYIGCQSIVYDTVYSLKWDLRSQGSWEIYYDKDFKIKQADYFTQNDTAFAITYFPNGQKKSEERHSEGYMWIYTAKWCANGQQIACSNPNNREYRTVTSFYCNGNKKWQGNLFHGKAYGLEQRWYENGQKKSENYHTPFNMELEKKGLLKDSLLSQRFWDKNGSLIQPPINEIALYNHFTTPVVQLPKEEMIIPYYDLKDQKGYDNSMSLFQKKVYEIAKLKNYCNCKVGAITLSFIVDKKGRIINSKFINGLDECSEKAFVKAVNKIKKWTPGILNDQIVNTKVLVILKLEEISK